MKFAVLTYADAPNPLGLPPQYPAEARPVEDDFVVEPPWIEMTQEELNARISLYVDQVQSVAAEKESVPAEVDLWKFRAAIRIAGLYDSVMSAIAALPENKRIVIEEKFRAKDTISRRDPTLVAMAASLGLTEAQVDNVFRTAHTLT